MQQILGIVIIFSAIISSMLLSGNITMFIDSQALLISLGIFLVGIIVNTTKETNFATHLKRVFTNEKLTISEVECSANFYSNMNKFTITASVITLIIAVIAVLHQFGQPKLLGPIIAVTLLVTIYTGIASICLFIPAKFKLLASLSDNNIADTSESNTFFKAVLGTILINVALISPWILGNSLEFLMDIPSIIMIAMVILGALVFVKNIRTKVLTQYIFSSLMTTGIVLYLVGVVAILSYDVDNFNQFLSAFGVSLITVVLAIIVVLPFSLLLNYMLQDNEGSIINSKLFIENNSFVKSYSAIAAVSSALTILIIIVYFPK
jgi:flagellar motor component MotA